MKPKIFIFAKRAPEWGGNSVLGRALAEDGTMLAEHLSSNLSYLQHDMGLRSNWHHTTYQAHYPEGYELVNLSLATDVEIVNNTEFQEALKKREVKGEQPA
jgi:hypothetical protein